MSRAIYILFFLFFFYSCQPGGEKKRNERKEDTAAIVRSSAPFDSAVTQMKAGRELSLEQVKAWKIIDTEYTDRSSESVYTDTTVQLNDSIFYSILHLGDLAGVCSHSFVVTVNERTRQPIGSAYLMPDCDVDYGQETYERYDYQIITPGRIVVTKTTVYQKKDRTSLNEEENIDHEEKEMIELLIGRDWNIRK